jgi:protein tyrosine phosphatase (PTP) superfamily phosphohydrolase (DUF442 family)
MSGTSGFSPMPSAPEQPAWRPNEVPSVRLGEPEPFSAARPPESARLFPPIVTEKATPGVEKPKRQDSAPALPVGIPQFANVKERVAAGLRPMLPDGMDWLQENNYRTVLHLRRPGEDSSPDRKQVEKRGMKYVSLEVSPATLSKQLMEDFNRIVANSTGQPLFVYDRDGSLAGAMWYLHFRTVEGSGDEVARIRAGAFGLREDREGAHREMWQAVRQFSQEQLKLP